MKLEGEYYKKNNLKFRSDINFSDELNIYKEKNNNYYISIENAGDFGIENCGIELSKDKILKIIKLLSKKIK